MESGRHSAPQKLVFQKQTPHKKGVGTHTLTYGDGTTGLHRTVYEGFSDHGMITYTCSDKKFASLNTLGPCDYVEAGGYFNNLQCVVETFQTYAERILGTFTKEGLLDHVLERLQENQIGAMTLQEAAFLKETPAVKGVNPEEWRLFKDKCESLIKQAGFEILKSAALEAVGALESKTNASLYGRECAILYKKDIYKPLEITATSINQSDATTFCASAEDMVYACLQNKKTYESFYLASVHLNYKKTHGPTKKTPTELAEEIVKSFNTTAPVFIIGDWNTPSASLKDNPKALGTTRCTSPNSSNTHQFVFTEDSDEQCEKGYDWIYVDNFHQSDTAKFTADIFLKSADGGAICVENGSTTFRYNHISHWREQANANIAEIDSYSVKTPTCYIGYAALLSSIATLAAKYLPNAPEFVKSNSYLALIGTAAGAALIYYGRDHVITTNIQIDGCTALTTTFRYGTNVILESHNTRS